MKAKVTEDKKVKCGACGRVSCISELRRIAKYKDFNGKSRVSYVCSNESCNHIIRVWEE